MLFLIVKKLIIKEKADYNRLQKEYDSQKGFRDAIENGDGAMYHARTLAAADLAMGKETALVKELLNSPTPKKLPFQPLTKVVVSSRIKLGEFLARKEL